ncbi:MAG: hypothetical protein HY424_01660 [Candidatus Levybacteria bacterium]|nr:hypothetical protein [Candidatus Levybacteria bacterium]
MAQKKNKNVSLRLFSQSGQILLIVILVVVVASTIGLSLASRSITNLRISTEEAESQKALAAAEAGIERAIQSNVPITINGNNPGNSSYSTDVQEIQSSTFLINGGNLISKDEGADIWFVGRNANGTPNYSTAISLTPPNNFFHLYWGSASEVCGTPTAPAAIQAIVVTRDTLLPNTIKTYRYAYDSCSRGNNFYTTATVNFEIEDQTFIVATPEGSNDLAKGVEDIIFIRVIPLYKDAVVGVSACNLGGHNCTALPSQGFKIESTGKSGSASRKITSFKGYPQTYLPYLSYGLFVAN